MPRIAVPWTAMPCILAYIAAACIGAACIATTAAAAAPKALSAPLPRDRARPEELAAPLEPVPSSESLEPPGLDGFYGDPSPLHGEPEESWLDEEPCCDSESSGACCSPGLCRSHGMFFAGAEYMTVRPRFSEATAYVRRTTIIDQTNGAGSSTRTDRNVEFPYDHSSGFRTFLGYRFCDCGGELQFTFWRMQGGANVVDGPAQVANEALIIFGALNNNPCDGEFFRASSDVSANLYDVDYSRCIPTSSCDGCCGGPCCPRWDLRWIAGVRVADINRHDTNEVFGDAGTDCLAEGDINADFSGAGPKIGLLGRRYCGPCNQFSLFAKGTGALLIGQYNSRRTLVNEGTDITPAVTSIREDSLTRLIPNAEIEVGGSWRINEHASFTTGYFFQAWFDLGSSPEIVGANLDFGNNDDANILGFDGFFARFELAL